MRSVPSGNTFGAKVGFARAIHAPRSLLPLDLPINGQNRKVLVRPERNGYMYVLDRSTGEVLSADPYVYTTATKGFDLKSGKVIENREKAPGFGRVAREICPSAPEGKDWQPSSWSPRTRMLYVPHNNLCMDIEGLEASYIAGTPYVGASVKEIRGDSGEDTELFTADELVTRAAQTGAAVRFVEDPALLAAAGGVGAMLRFRL